MLVTAPARLDGPGGEALLASLARIAPRIPEGIDCSRVRFVDPAGTLLLLAVGLSASFRGRRAWGLVMPRDAAVRSWLERMGAAEHLERLFVVEGAGEGRGANRVATERVPVLLEVALIEGGEDVHRVVARVKARADLLLVGRLGYSALAADRFTVAVAEICQNVVDHSGGPGLAAAQCYGGPGSSPPEIRLAVADAGIGVRASLAPRYSGRHGAGWDDRTALRLALRSGVTRFDDPGRGLGLAAVAAMTRSWGGGLRMRSGTAACGVGPLALRTGGRGLGPLPGTQVAVRLPHASDAAR